MAPPVPQDVPFNTQDAYVQVNHISAACRVIAYHADPILRLRLYPNGGAAEAALVPLEPGADKNDTCLVHFSRLAVTPLEFVHWLETSILRFTICRVFFMAGGTASCKDDLVQQIIAAGPPPGRLRLMIFPRSMEAWLGDELPEEFELHPVNFESILMVVRLPDGRLLHQVRPGAELFRTDHAGPQRVPGQLSRAAGKLSEALMVSGFQAGAGAAVDVGAAPGGWTAQLAACCPLVIAVDPAIVLPAVAELPNVVHLKQKCDAEGAVAVAAALGERWIDLLVCDMNHHPCSVIELLRPLFHLLRPGGMLVLTCKFRGVGRDKSEILARLVEQLADGDIKFEGVRLYWLLANTQSERTMVAMRADGTAGGARDGAAAPAVPAG